jgi:hypothetical protein
MAGAYSVEDVLPRMARMPGEATGAENLRGLAADRGRCRPGQQFLPRLYQPGGPAVQREPCDGAPGDPLPLVPHDISCRVPLWLGRMFLVMLMG